MQNSSTLTSQCVHPRACLTLAAQLMGLLLVACAVAVPVINLLKCIAAQRD